MKNFFCVSISLFFSTINVYAAILLDVQEGGAKTMISVDNKEVSVEDYLFRTREGGQQVFIYAQIPFSIAHEWHVGIGANQDIISQYRLYLDGAAQDVDGGRFWNGFLVGSWVHNAEETQLDANKHENLIISRRITIPNPYYYPQVRD